MPKTSQKEEKVEVSKERIKNLEEKAATLDDLLSLVEDRYLGKLMEKTEGETEITLSEAKQELKEQ